MKVDESCIKVRAIGAIFNSKKDLKEKVKLMAVYIPALNMVKLSTKPSLEEEIVTMKIVQDWVKIQGVKCVKFFKKMGIDNNNDRKLVMDELMGLNHILDKL